MKKKLSNEELITFCGQMALILKSGISSLEGIYIMEDGDVQTEGREILKEIREELEMCVECFILQWRKQGFSQNMHFI